jgi:ABC-2 type transport system permease protein
MNLGLDLERIRVMVQKEFRQVFRDSRMLRVIFVSPLVQLVVFGYAVSTDIRHTATFVVDLDHTQASRQLVETLTASGYFEVVGRGERPDDLIAALERGTAIVGVEIPVGFGRDLADGSGANVQLLLDGTNSNTALVARGYAERIVQRFGVDQAGGGPRPSVDLRERAWFNPALESRDYNVPAVVGTIVLLVCLLLTALAVVREREIGTLEQLMVSPLRPAELIAGKTLPFALLGLLDLTIVTAAAILWFHVPFRGSWLLYLLASVLYLFSGLGLGLLLSTTSNTQQEAFMTTFLIFMPTMLLSGFMFPVASMPEIFQALTLVNPLRHYLEIVRALFLKGAGFGALWPQYLALLLIGVGLLGLATTRFHKRAD